MSWLDFKLQHAARSVRVVRLQPTMYYSAACWMRSGLHWFRLVRHCYRWVTQDTVPLNPLWQLSQFLTS